MTKCQIFVLPSGSALVAVGAFQSIYFFMQLATEIGFFLQINQRNASFGSLDFFALCVTGLQIFTSIVYWNFILQRRKVMLFLWTLLYLISCLSKFYILSQSVTQIPSFSWIFTSIILIYVGMFAMSIIHVARIYNHRDNCEDCEPMTKSIAQLWRFYKIDNTEIAVKLSLILEMAWSTTTLVAFQIPMLFLNLTLLGHPQSTLGGSTHQLITAEELYMRGIRVVMAVIGLIIFPRKNTRALRIWVMVSLTFIIASGVLYYCIFQELHNDKTEGIALSYQFLFSCDLLSRFVIIYFSVRNIEYLDYYN